MGELRCPVGCEGDLEPMGRWAPYQTCRHCGSAVQQLAPPSAYWGPDVEPSAEQHAFWAGRDAQRMDTIGRGPGRLLDVGCGFGHFVRWAGDHGWDAWGVEADEWGAKRTETAGRVFRSIDDVQHLAPFDVVTMWDVLEHVVHPLGLLDRLRSILAPRGRLLVVTPNFASMKLRWSFYRHRPDRFAAVIRPHEHVIQFTTQGLVLAFRRSGFVDVKVLNPPPPTDRNPVVSQLVQRIPVLRQGQFVEGLAPDVVG